MEKGQEGLGCTFAHLPMPSLLFFPSASLFLCQAQTSLLFWLNGQRSRSATSLSYRWSLFQTCWWDFVKKLALLIAVLNYIGCACKEWALISAVLSLELSRALNSADSLNWGWWLGIKHSRGLSGCWVWYLKPISPAFQKTDKVGNRWGVKVVLKKSISSQKLQFNKCLDISGSNSL